MTLVLNDSYILFNLSAWTHFPIYQALLLAVLLSFFRFYYNRKKKKENKIPETPERDAVFPKKCYVTFKALQRESYFQRKIHYFLSTQYLELLETISFKKAKPYKFRKIRRYWHFRPRNIFTFFGRLFQEEIRVNRGKDFRVRRLFKAVYNHRKRWTNYWGTFLTKNYVNNMIDNEVHLSYYFGITLILIIFIYFF